MWFVDRKLVVSAIYSGLLILGKIAVSLATAGSSCHAQEDRTLQLFLMAGQSNMAGADSEVEGQVFVQTESDRMTRFTAASIPFEESRFVPWGDIRGHRIKDKLTHGPEVGFSRTLYSEGWKHLAIIKVSGNFRRDATDWPWGEGNTFFKIWTQFVDDRVDELKKEGYTVKVAGFVWHQGIDDAIHQKLAVDYQQNLTHLIESLRRRYASPNTPFVLARSVFSPIAQPSPDPDQSSPMAHVRRAQVAVADAVPHVGWIDTDDLPKVNRHHFSAASQIIIGQRFATEYLRLLNGTNR